MQICRVKKQGGYAGWISRADEQGRCGYAGWKSRADMQGG